jgi:N-acetylated-alpha-linked acidic dipeptidase
MPELKGVYGKRCRKLQRLKPLSFCGPYVAAEAATHKESRVATATVKLRPSKSRYVLASCFAGMLVCAVAMPVHAQAGRAISGFAPGRVEAERRLEEKFRSLPDAGRAEANLRHLTSEPHMAGTEASHRVAEWLCEQYRSYGFEAEILRYSAWLPQPREVKLELTKPAKRTLASREQPIEGDADTDDARATEGFNAYSPSGEVTAPVVYVNYGLTEDYRALASLGVSVEGKIAIARYGGGYRGIKAKLAEEHKAAALILYSDPSDDGYAAGDAYPQGPWRPMSSIQRGSVAYTELYPGDPLTSGAAPGGQTVAPADAANLPRIPTMPINAQDAAVILANLRGPHVPRSWQGGLPFTYHAGPGAAEVHMKLVMDYQERPLYDVIAKLHGTVDDQWVMLGNHHDAWVFGAADPGSGTSAMLEMARGLGELVRAGWKPRRTIVIGAWDGEEPGLIGSTEWVEANRAEVQAKAVVYINTDVGVTGRNFIASATPSLGEWVREVTRDIEDPATGGSVYAAWSESAARDNQEMRGVARTAPRPDASTQAPLGALGAGSDFCPFFDYAGIPSIDLAFSGDYGVYHSVYDDFHWMKHFGDPTFTYHAALARVLGTMALRFDEADILPFDYPAYAREIARGTHELAARGAHQADADASLKAVSDAAATLSASASRAEQALHAISAEPLDAAKAEELNRDLAGVEQALLAPRGLAGRPWFKHTVFAPGSYAGYAAEVMPGVSEALGRNDVATLRTEAGALAEALTRAAARLDEIARLAQDAEASPAVVGH